MPSFELPTLVTFGLTIGGLLLGLVALKPMTEWLWPDQPRLAYQIRSDRVLDTHLQPFIESIRIQSGGKAVERITLTTLVLWNVGRSGILSSNLDPSDPLRIEFDEGAEILERKVLDVGRDGFVAEPIVPPDKPNTLLFGARYFNPGDGIALDVWHTGSTLAPKLQGSIQGPRSWFKDHGPPEILTLSNDESYPVSPTSLFCMSLAGVLLFLTDYSSIRFIGLDAQLSSRIVEGIIVLLMVPMFRSTTLGIYRDRRGPPDRLRHAAMFRSSGADYRLFNSIGL
jgi:hypothetical protein